MTTSPAFQTISALLDDPASGITIEEMRTLYKKIGEHTLSADEKAAVAATQVLVTAYEALGVSGVVAVEFATSEWDNGYFLSADSATLIGADENVIEFDESDVHPDDALFEAIDSALTQCVDASLGSRSHATVHIAKGTFTLNV